MASNQIRRAAISIPSNIAEGAARQTKKEFIQFLHVAQGSLSELDTQINISLELKYLKRAELNGRANAHERYRQDAHRSHQVIEKAASHLIWAIQTPLYDS